MRIKAQVITCCTTVKKMARENSQDERIKRKAIHEIMKVEHLTFIGSLIKNMVGHELNFFHKDTKHCQDFLGQPLLEMKHEPSTHTR